jgi:hypothetical protein
MNDKICAVFVCNAAYYNNFRMTCHLLLSNGNYKGDVLLIIGDDLYDKSSKQFILDDEFIIQNKIQVKYFPDYVFDDSFLDKQKNLKRDAFWYQKRFQYHKFHLFDTYFKQWSYIFYMDCGIRIFSDVAPILNERRNNTILANRDGLDSETADWCIPETPGDGVKIGDQFVKSEPEFQLLKENYNIKAPYFQTTVMLFDTNIITNETKSHLYDLLFKYPISLTNDQGIIALYFTQVKPCWIQLRRKNDETYFYDYVRCVNEEYIMVKSMASNYFHIGYR